MIEIQDAITGLLGLIQSVEECNQQSAYTTQHGACSTCAAELDPTSPSQSDPLLKDTGNEESCLSVTGAPALPPMTKPLNPSNSPLLPPQLAEDGALATEKLANPPPCVAAGVCTNPKSPPKPPKPPATLGGAGFPTSLAPSTLASNSARATARFH